MLEILELHSVSSEHIGYPTGADIVFPFAAIMPFELLNDLAVEYTLIKPAFALVGLAILEVSEWFVEYAAIANEASLCLDHHLIDLIELRSGGVERLRSVVISGDTPDVSANSI
jgi:hypothetical protein